MAVTLRQILAFLEVAEQGTFTKAAARMHLAQPALSQLVRELERELGLRLFDRTTRRVELTEGGREFRAASGKIIQDLDVAIRNASDIAELRRGRVIIAAPPLLAAVLLPQAIAELNRIHPGLQVTLLDAPTETIVKAVRAGQAHCGCGTFSIAKDGIERSQLARDSLLLFCSPKHPLARRKVMKWKELKEQPLIALTRNSGIRLRVEVGFEAAKMQLNPAFEVSQITTALALAEAGLGVAVLPSYARAAAPHRILAAIALIEPTITRDIVMIRASGRSPEPAVATVEQILRRHIRRVSPR